MTIQDVAKKMGYSRAEKTKALYKGYDVYKCVLDDSDDLFTGTPVFILVKDGKYKVSCPQDWMEISREIRK